MELSEKRSPRRREGDRGENAAAEFLTRNGYRILDRQWRCRYGELDIVALSPEGILCFVEVKLRRAGSMILPREAVGLRKQERIRLTASAWLNAYDSPSDVSPDTHDSPADNPQDVSGVPLNVPGSLSDCPARFDVAEVYAFPDGSLRVVYLEDAFYYNA